jgi:hypothetical protein
MGKWEDLTEDLTPEGAATLSVGQIMRFDYEGSPLELKIMRKKLLKDGKVHVWAKHVTTHDPNDIYVTETDEEGHTESVNMGDLL